MRIRPSDPDEVVSQAIVLGKNIRMEETGSWCAFIDEFYGDSMIESGSPKSKAFECRGGRLSFRFQFSAKNI